ncbi:MAG: inositol monophosphatase [Opitutus sp.]|nr:inositol monophosphatase [Opitutus sp.]
MTINPERVRRLLCQLQDSIRESVRAARRGGLARMGRVAAVTASDTIYGVDKISEETVLAWLEQHWPRRWPIELVMEGLDEHGAVTFPRGTPVAATKWKLILDPIDGTRGLMFDKRSAWSLAALAPQRGTRNTTADLFVAAMTELPTSKSGFADQLSAVRRRGMRAERLDLRTGGRKKFRPPPSRATSVAHGFASFAKFFPEGKAWLAAREEALWRELGLSGASGGQPVFDDQYLTTGGQLYELIMGHDRFIADLRPVAFERLKIARGAALACHPYDICTALIAEEAGCVVRTLEGKSLRAPLDTTSPVAWVGYANRSLARRIGPVLRRVMAR